MHPTIIKELIALLLLLIFIGLFYVSMPPMAYAIGYLAVVAMFAVFVGSLLKSTDRDEREEKHRMVAAESGFVVGGVLLLVAIAKQTFVMHDVDPWLFAALVGMLVARLVVRIYLDKKN